MLEKMDVGLKIIGATGRVSSNFRVERKEQPPGKSYHNNLPFLSSLSH